MTSIVKQIIEKKLQRKIISFEKLSVDAQMQSFNVLTDRGYVDLRLYKNIRKFSIEKEVLILCRKKGLPVPQVILSEQFQHDNQTIFILAESIKGKPFIDLKFHIYDYNRVLTQLAEVLIKLHSIKLHKFGDLKPDLKGGYENWQMFITKDLDSQLEFLEESLVLSKAVMKIIPQFLYFESGDVSPLLLHGTLSNRFLFIDYKEKISSLTNFVQPMAGDANWDLAGFLIYDGFDRAKRLVKSYYLLGGQVEWDSEQFLKTSLRRAIGVLYFRIRNKKGNISGVLQIIHQLAAMLKALE